MDHETYKKAINTEFQYYYEKVLQGVSKLPQYLFDNIKTGAHSICETNCKTRRPSTYETVNYVQILTTVNKVAVGDVARVLTKN